MSPQPGKMSGPRANRVFLIVGGRGTGKTTLLKGDPQLGIQGLINQRLAQIPAQRVLVVDTFDNPVWRHYPLIYPTAEDLQSFTGCARVYSSNTPAMLERINSYVYSSMIIYEDSTKFIRKNLSDATRQFIIDSKQKNLDLFFVFHFLGAVPPELATLADWLILFKTTERFNSWLKSKFPNPLIEKTFETVQAHRDKFHWEAAEISGA